MVFHFSHLAAIVCAFLQCHAFYIGMTVVRVSSIEQFQHIRGNKVILYTARNCQACKVVRPKFADLSEEWASTHIFCEFSIDCHESLLQEAQRLRIKTLPTICVQQNRSDKESTICVPVAQSAKFEHVKAMLHI